jgi:hypothetical protein
VSGWQPIETAPRDVEVLVLLDDGRTAVAEYWAPPPVEIDPDQTFGGWAYCLVGRGKYDLGLPPSHEIGEPTHWQPLPEPPEGA